MLNIKSKKLNLKKAIGIISLILVLFISQTNQINAHQPFEIIKSPQQETTIDLSDASVSHAFYGKFESVNEEFDPEYHEAIMMKKTKKKTNIIIEEYQKGYTQHDKVLRHAKVIVSE